MKKMFINRKLSEKIKNLLLKRLIERGVTPLEAYRLIKDVSNIISDNENYTPLSINQALKWLGWESNIVDNYNFELIIFLLEEGFEDPLNVQNLKMDTNKFSSVIRF